MEVADSQGMPEKETIERAKRDKAHGKSASSQAGEFVREEMHHIREGKHGAKNTKQAIAIGLSKARRAGVKLGTPKRGRASAGTRKAAARDVRAGQRGRRKAPSARRSRATRAALKRQPHSAASHTSLSKHARASARQRGKADLKRAARKAMRTKGKAGLRAAGRKAARTRAKHAA